MAIDLNIVADQGSGQLLPDLLMSREIKSIIFGKIKFISSMKGNTDFCMA